MEEGCGVVNMLEGAGDQGRVVEKLNDGCVADVELDPKLKSDDPIEMRL